MEDLVQPTYLELGGDTIHPPLNPSFGIPIPPKENMRWTQPSDVDYALFTGCKAAF
jgi:hypothetical protein